MITRKCIACFVSLTMVITTLFSIPPASYAAEPQDSLTSTKGVYWFDPHITGIDLTDNYIYDDALLTGDSLELNWSLAAMTYELAVMSISSEREPRTEEGYKNKSRNIRAYLEDNGFIDFDTNEDYKKVMTTRTMGAACAHKKIMDGDKEYTLLAIVPRSAGYEAEWGGNFILGETGDHEGFRIGKEKVLGFAKEYVEKYGIKGDIKVWTAGYSRGAAVTNQVGAEILRDPEKALGSSVTLKPGDFYCYTFGTPNSAGTDSDYQDSKYDYIHNIWESYDITTVVPFEVLGFGRYGKNFSYADKGDKERMLSLLKELNIDVYNDYTTTGDPEGFKPKKLDVTALAVNHELKFVDDDDSYIPSTQKEFAALLANTAKPAFHDRKGYVETTQDAVEDLGGYYYSHLDKGGAIAEGAMGSKYAIPAVISLYIAYMSDRYRDNAITPEDREELEKWMKEFEKYVDRAIETGEKIPQEVMDKMAELKDQIKTASKLNFLVDASSTLSAYLVSYTLRDALTNAGLPEEDKDLFDRLTSLKESYGLAHAAAYFLLYDEKQTEGITFSYLNQQFKHLATLIGNAGSYQRPHNNEVILSWLRTLDPNYDDFVKENEAQTAGYRRLYIDQPDGVTVKGQVKDGSGKVAAEFENGKMVSRTDKWIGITTCDTGNWLRLPVDQTYKVELSVDKDAKLDLKAAEFSVYDGKEVRTVTEDKEYKWTGLEVKTTDKVTWVITEVPGAEYSLPSEAYYYIEKVSEEENPDDKKDDENPDDKKDDDRKDSDDKIKLSVPTKITFAKVPDKLIIKWSKVKNATGYVVKYRKVGGKWTTKKTSKTRVVLKGLKNGKLYQFKVAAFRKESGSGKVTEGKYCKTIYRFYKRIKPVKFTAGEKSIKASWGKVKGADGYEILISKHKDLSDSKSVIVKGKNKTKRTVKGLKPGRYYVSIRAYKEKSGTKYRGIRRMPVALKVK